MNTSKLSARRLAGIGTAAAAGATVVNAAIYGLGRAAGLDFVASTTSSGPQHIMLVHVVALTLQAFAVGVVVALLANTFRRPSLTTVQIAATILAVGSVAMDVSIDSTFAAKATLALMHLAAGAVYVTALGVARASRPAETAAARAPHANHATHLGHVAA